MDHTNNGLDQLLKNDPAAKIKAKTVNETVNGFEGQQVHW